VSRNSGIWRQQGLPVFQSHMKSNGHVSAKKQLLRMATEIRQAGTLGLNGIFYAVSEVGGAVLSVAVGASNPFLS
jgi:hypothetical protein